MKLPQQIEGIYREGRSDSFSSVGVEPALFGKIWNVIKKPGKAIACKLCKAACNRTVC